MAKKKNGVLKLAVGIGAAAVAGKVAYDKFKAAKSKLTKEENDSAELEVRKYNAVCENRMVEIEDEEFMGCEVKAIASKMTLDLSLAVFEKDVYINFESICANVSIVLPDGVNVTCDIDKKLAKVGNYVENSDEDGIHTVYIIGKADLSKVEVVPVNFYVDDEDDYEDTGFQHLVKPQTGAAAVALSERVGDIHLHIFFDDLVKGGLRHLVDVSKRRLQIHQRRKAEIALCQIHRAQLTGKVINIFKQIFVNCLQSREFTRRERIEYAVFKQFYRLFLAEAFFFTGKVGGACQPQFIFQCHRASPD